MSTSMALPFARAAARVRAKPCFPSSASHLPRSFSTSPRLAVRAVFGAASNDTLRSALDEIQHKITLPAYLPPEQRRILMNPMKKTFIEQNPVVIEIEGLKHRYTKPIVPADLPNSKSIYKTAVRAMETAEDWANLESLLAGYKKAGIVLKAKHFGLTSRRALDNGHLYTLIDCARHARDTGYMLTLSQSGLLVLQGIADRAMTQDHVQAIKWLEQVQDILERAPHSELYGQQDLRSSILARGMMLAARVSDIQASENASEAQLNHLSDEIERIRALWKKALASADGALNLDIDESLNGFRELATLAGGDLIAPWALVRMIAHNIKALEAAPAIVDQPCEPLSDASRRLDEYLTSEVKQYVERDSRLQEQLSYLASPYYEVLGRAPTWAEPIVEKKSNATA